MCLYYFLSLKAENTQQPISISFELLKIFDLRNNQLSKKKELNYKKLRIYSQKSNFFLDLFK